MVLSPLAVSIILISATNALCSWNRAIDPADAGGEMAKTLNFINGDWVRDQSQSSGATFNGQQYWKQTNNDGCYVTTLWLYYYKGQNDGEYQWLISATFGSTPSSAYVMCALDMPQPTNPVNCNDYWLFAPNGTPSPIVGNYVVDTDYKLRDGDCPQVLCDTLEFATESNDIYAGTYTRVSTNDQNNQNVYKQTTSNSNSGEFYLYFNQNTFSWLIDDELDLDCQRATGGQVIAATQVGKWATVSATDSKFWYFTETDANGEFRSITCGGQIPTTSPSASDATGYPTPSPSNPVNCFNVPSYPSCQPTSVTPSPVDTPAPVANYPTQPTLPGTGTDSVAPSLYSTTTMILIGFLSLFSFLLC